MKIVDLLKSGLAKVKQALSSLGTNTKLIILLAASIALVIKFRDILIDLLLKNSKQIEDKAKATDDQLAKKEEGEKTEADALVQQAADLPKQEGVVTDDWYKKKE